MKPGIHHICLCCLFALGCGQTEFSEGVGRADANSNEITVKGDATETTDDSKIDNKDADSEITVKILDWEATEELIAGHKGKVVVVDLWSLSCLPCVREFPGLVELHNTHKDQVACISVSCDYDGIESEPPESKREKVLKFLTKKGATFDNVLSSVPLVDLSNKLDFGSIPVVYVYGKDGTLKQRFDNDEELYGEDGFSYEKQITPLVEKLIEAE